MGHGNPWEAAVPSPRFQEVPLVLSEWEALAQTLMEAAHPTQMVQNLFRALQEQVPLAALTLLQINEGSAWFFPVAMAGQSQRSFQVLPLRPPESSGAAWAAARGVPTLEEGEGRWWGYFPLGPQGRPRGVLIAEGVGSPPPLETLGRLGQAGGLLGLALSGRTPAEAAALEARLHRLALGLQVSGSLPEILTRILQELVDLLRADRGAAALMAAEGDHLTVVAEYNPIGAASGIGTIIPIAGNPSMAWILRERRPLAIADTRDPILGPVGPVLQRLGIRSLLIVPLVVEERVIGTIGIDSVRAPRAFTEAEQDLAAIVAAQVAWVVERARALEEAQRRAAHLEALHAVLREALEVQDLTALMDRALGHLRKALGAPIGALWLEGRAVVHGAPEALGQASAAAARATDMVLEGTHAVSDWTAVPEGHPLAAWKPALLAFGIRSSLVVPVVRGGERLGGLVVADHAARSWRTEEMTLVETVGRELGAVAERLRLLEDLRRREARLRVLYRVAEALNQAPRLPALVEAVLEALLADLPADAASVYMVEPEGGGELRLVAQRGFSVENMAFFGRQPLVGGIPTITREALQRGEALWVEAVEAFPYPPAARAVMEQEGIRSFASVPLRHEEEGLGVLNVAWRRPQRLDAETRALLERVADLVAAGLHRARLMTQEEAQARALREALRLREEMIQNVSHELRTPLTVALGYLELMAEGAFGALSPEQAEAVAVCRGRLAELRRYVELLLMLQAARGGALAQQPVEVVHLIEEVVRVWQAGIEAGRYRVVVRLPEAPVWVLGDVEALARAIGELLGNAAKFMLEGGELGIALTATAQEIMVRVWDEGIGIPTAALGRVGEPFYQVDGGPARRFGGMGIGLALARAVAEAHGGRLEVRPRHPKGTEVCLILPRLG